MRAPQALVPGEKIVTESGIQWEGIFVQVTANDIAIEIEDHGSKDDPAILLIMGYTAQLVFWPDELVEALVGAGFRVIRYDNRDVGLSHKFDGTKVPHPIWQLLVKRFRKNKQMAPYTLEDMAADAIGVLDVLEIDKAHIVGASMGGMIAQIVGAEYPDRVLSLVPVMTSTNNPKLPGPDKKVRKMLWKSARNRPDTPEEAVPATMGFFEVIAADTSAEHMADVEALIRTSVERSFYPEGPKRQMAAIIDSGDLRRFDAKITAPTLVIHGAADPLIPPAGGEDVAANIAGARYETIPGMGHDLPRNLLPQVTQLIVEHCRAHQ